MIWCTMNSSTDRNAYKREWRRQWRLKQGIAPRPVFASEEEKVTHHSAKKAEWREKNRAARVEYAVQWNKNNPVARRAAQKKWKESASGRLSAGRYKRKRRSRESSPAWANLGGIDSIYAGARDMALTVDHIVPLVHPLVCGLHVESNLFVMPLVDNQKKGNRWWPCMP